VIVLVFMSDFEPLDYTLNMLGAAQFFDGKKVTEEVFLVKFVKNLLVIYMCKLTLFIVLF